MLTEPKWWGNLRDQTRFYLEKPQESVIGMAIFFTTIVMIATSSLTLCISSLPELSSYEFWATLETIFVSYFTIEYVLKIWSSKGERLKRITEFMGVIDLLSILPFWIELLINSVIDENGSYGSVGVVLRLLRLLRILRVVRVSRYSVGLQLVGKAMRVALPVLRIFFLVLLMSVSIFAYLIHYVERGDWNEERREWEVIPFGGGPKVKSQFQSAFDGIWFSIETVTTVGDGDIVVTTSLGKLLATILMVLGILSIAFPTSAVGAAYIQEYEAAMEAKSSKKELKKKNDKLQNKPETGGKPTPEQLHLDYAELLTIQNELLELIEKYDPIIKLFQESPDQST